MVYQWREGARVNIAPEVAGQALDAIQKRDGKIETVAVVEAATPEDSPLHPAFEWRDDVAAHQYRLDQARGLVRALIVVPEGEVEHAIPAYVHVKATTDEPGYYQDTTIALQNADEWSRVIDEMSRYTAALVRVLETLQSLAPTKGKGMLRKVTRAQSAIAKARDAVKELAA